jgi:hypothetical protein|tara:strand:+ start:404 stop:583 length:180 start_codon:yes stop_codon:yes gene_type:complete
MSEQQQELIYEGANIIALLINTVIEVEERPRNEEDDLLMEKAEEWVDENGALSIELTEY